MGKTPQRLGKVAGAATLGLAALIILVAERTRPLRRATQAEPRRSVVNLTLGAMSLAVVALVETPLTRPLAKRGEHKRAGLVQHLNLPASIRDAAAVLLMDYTIYLWHVATHKVPFLWRFHLVHHIDLDLDSTTALRFHGVDMAISAPVRAAQVAMIGISPRALQIWQGLFIASVLFHHSNVRLPERFERLLARFVTTPRMHGIHHSAVHSATDSNWSSGFAFWDHLHRTFRLDVAQAAQEKITIGVPAYRDPAEAGLLPSLALPFTGKRNAWSAPPHKKPTAMQ
jgi:sterol desaturase/sphingolipid hydroxylase (fatty acid hydroxylase superfamily)